MYCMDCGKKLQGEYNKCYKCTDEHAGEKHYCPACGGGNHKLAKKCQHCDKNIEHDFDYVRRAPNTEPKSRKTAAIWAFTLGFVGMHEKYLGFSKKALRRMIWFASSVIIAAGMLLAMQLEFSTFIVNGTYDQVAGDKLAPWLITLAIIMGVGVLSALVSFITAIMDGFIILKDKSYLDAEGQQLK